jgi:hypothetical protein
MSMSAPFEPGRRTPDDENPAADPGPGQHADPPDDPPERPRDDVPFRTPDPGEVGRS